MRCCKSILFLILGVTLAAIIVLLSILTYTSYCKKTEKNHSYATALDIAKDQLSTKKVCPRNFDTGLYRKNDVLYYPWLFSKSLKHDKGALCNKTNMDSFLDILTAPKQSENSARALQTLQSRNCRMPFVGLFCGYSTGSKAVT